MVWSREALAVAGRIVKQQRLPRGDVSKIADMIEAEVVMRYRRPLGEVGRALDALMNGPPADHLHNWQRARDMLEEHGPLIKECQS